MASDVQLGADLDMRDVAKAFGTLPGMAAKESKAAAKEITKAFRETKAAARDAAKAQAAAAREAKEATAELEKGLKGVAELAGVSGEQYEKLKDVVTGLNNPVVLVASSTALAAAAVVGLAAGIVGIVSASADLAKELAPYQEIGAFAGIDPAAEESIYRANDAMAAMAVAAQQAVLVLGGELAPMVGEAAVGIVTLELAALDMVTGVESMTDSFDAMVAKVSSLNPLLSDFGTTLETLLVASGPLGAVLQVTGQGFELAAVGAKDYRAEAELLVGAVEAEREAEDKEKEATDGAAEAKRRKAQADREAAQAAREAAAVVREQATALEALEGVAHQAQLAQLDGIDLVLAKRNDELAKIDELLAKTDGSVEAFAAAEAARVEVFAASEAEISEIKLAIQATDAAALAKSSAAHEAEHKAELARIKEGQDAATASAQAKLGVASDLTAGLGALADAALQAQVNAHEEGSQAAKDAARTQFRVAKAVAIVQAGIATAQALIQSVATLGPPVPPNAFGIAGFAAAAAIGVGTIASIAAQPAPSFHIGGTRIQGGSPDEVGATVLRDESLLTDRGTQAAGGPAGVDALNRGESAGGGTQVVQMRYKHRIFNEFVEDNLRTGGPLGRAVRGSSRRRGIV